MLSKMEPVVPQQVIETLKAKFDFGSNEHHNEYYSVEDSRRPTELLIRPKSLVTALWAPDRQDDITVHTNGIFSSDTDLNSALNFSKNFPSVKDAVARGDEFFLVNSAEVGLVHTTMNISGHVSSKAKTQDDGQLVLISRPVIPNPLDGAEF